MHIGLRFVLLVSVYGLKDWLIPRVKGWFGRARGDATRFRFSVLVLVMGNFWKGAEMGCEGHDDGVGLHDSPMQGPDTLGGSCIKVGGRRRPDDNF